MMSRNPSQEPAYKIWLTEKESIPNVYISKNNIMHILFPLIGAYVEVDKGEITTGIASDNTCKTQYQQKDFVNNIQHNLNTFHDQLVRSVQLRQFFSKPDETVNSLLAQTKHWQPIVRYLIQNHLSVNSSEQKPLSINEGRGNPLIVVREMQKKNSRLKYFLIKPEFVDHSTYGHNTNPTCTFDRSGHCYFYKDLSQALKPIIEDIRPGQTVNLKDSIVNEVYLFLQQKAKKTQVAITPNFLKANIFEAFDSVYVKYFPERSNFFSQPSRALQNQFFSNWPDPYDYPNSGAPFQDETCPITHKISTVENILTGLIRQVPGGLELDDNIFEQTNANQESALTLFDKYFKASDFSEPNRFNQKSIEQKRNERKIDNLCILIQIFIASVNQYAVAEAYTEQNFGQLLESSSPLRKTFIQGVITACRQSIVRGVEQAICGFINENHKTFRLNKQLSNHDIELIIKRFNNEIRFIWSESTPHFDEFVRLMKSKRDGNQKGWDFFLFYKAAFCFNLLSALKNPCFQSDGQLQALLENVKEARKEVDNDYQSDIFGPSSDWNDVIVLKQEQISSYIIEILKDTSDRSGLKLNFLLCKFTQDGGAKDNGGRVFELLPNDFYSALRTNAQYMNKFQSVRQRIVNNIALLNRFNNKVCSSSYKSLQLTPNVLDALNAARFDRQNYFGQYDFKTVDGIQTLLKDLKNLGERPETQDYSKGFDIITHKEKAYIYPQPNNSFLLESDQDTIQKLNEIIRGYKDIRIVTMPEIASVYKYLQFNQHPGYADMDKLVNNQPVENQSQTIRPLKIMRAFDLAFHNAIQIIGMNATQNTLEWLSKTNSNDGKTKKGGAGCMGTANLQAWKQLQDIHGFWHDRWPLNQEHETALIQAVNFKCPDFYKELIRIVQPNDYTRELQLKCALDLFDIHFYGLYFEKDQLIVQFNLKEQSKLKYVLHFGGYDKKRLPLNGDDLAYWGENHAPKIIKPDIINFNNTLELVQYILKIQKIARQVNPSTKVNVISSPNPTPSNEIRLPITPEISACLYHAWLDRIYPESNDVMQYMVVGSVSKYLKELANDAIHNRYSQGLNVLEYCRVDGDHILGPTESMKMLNGLILRYRNTLHCSVNMNTGLYQQVERIYGENSDVNKYINAQLFNNLDKNQNAFTKSHKLLACLYALNLELSNLRFNSECNHQSEKKGGFGNLGEAENNTENVITYLQTIPDVCGNDVKINVQTELLIQDFMDQLQHPKAPLIQALIRFHEKDANGKPKMGVEDRLAAFEIRLLLLGFSCHSLRLSKPSDINSEVIVTLHNVRIDGPRLKWFSQSNSRHDYNLAGAKEQRPINADDEGILKGYTPKIIEVSDESLISLQALRSIKNTWPIYPPHVPIKRTTKKLNMEDLCPDVNGRVPPKRTLEKIKAYVKTLPRYKDASSIPAIEVKPIEPVSAITTSAPVQESRNNPALVMKLVSVQADTLYAKKTYAVLMLTGMAFATVSFSLMLSGASVFLSILGALGVISLAIGVMGLIYHHVHGHDGNTPGRTHLAR